MQVAQTKNAKQKTSKAKLVIFCVISTVYSVQQVYAEEVEILWTIPPISSSGDIGYSTRYTKNSIGIKEYGQLLTTNYAATSYILSPTFANINATIGTISTVSDSSQNSNEQKNEGLSLVGGLNVDLFNSSKYPVGLSFSHTDSRTNSVFSTSDFTETRFGIRQTYYTEDNKTISTSFDRSSINQNDKNDVVTSFGGNYNFQTWGIANSINTKYTLSDRDETKEGSRVASFNSSHNISLDNGLNLSAFSSFNNNSLRYLSENKISQFAGKYFILGGTAEWKPEFESREDDPLTISSSVSFVESKTAASTGESKATQISASLSGNYVLTENINIGVSGTLIKSVIDGKSKTTGIGGAALNTSYMGDPFKIGGFTYNWNINGGVTQQSGTDSNPIWSANAGAVHGLTRTFDLDSNNRISLSLSQNASKYKSYSLKETAFNSLSTNVSGVYSFTIGEDFPGSISATVSDIRTTGDVEQHYKNVNVMLSGHGQLTNRSSASMNISYNFADQSQRILSDAGYGPIIVNDNSNIVGTASYRHNKFLGIPQLNYVTSLTVDTLLTDNRLYGDVNGNYQKIRLGYENRFEYQFGLINLSLSAIYNDSGKDKNSMIFFSIRRTF